MNTRVGRSSWRATLILIFFMIFTACLMGCGENTNNEPSGVATPTNLTATGSGGPPPMITLIWTASNGAVSYQIYRDGTPISPIRAGNLAIDTNVLPRVWYCYSITATDATGHESLRSAPVCTATDAGRIATLTASSDEVDAGGSSVITANVTDADGNAIRGEVVTFTIAVNGSGATFSNGALSVQAATDAGGNAVAVYVAGGNNPLSDVGDSVRAVLTNGSSGAVAITRKAGTGTTPTPSAISVAAAPASVSAGQVSVITATLTGSSKVGVTVTFSILTNNSGATLSSSTAVTDGDGKAVVIYQPGANNPTNSVQDSIQAAVDTATSAVAITRIGSSTSAYIITATAAPDTLTADDSSSVVTANVKNNAGTAVSGVTVNFAVSGVAGTLSVASATTDGAGNAQTTLTGPGGAVAAGSTSVVTASITVGGNTYTAAAVITYP